MHPIVIKYMRFVCIAQFWANVSCTNYPLDTSRGYEELNSEAGCIAACMQMSMEAILANCYEKCQWSNQTVTLKETNNNETIQLICRETDSLIIEVISHRVTDNFKLESQQQHNHLLFMLKVQESLSAEQSIYIADSPIMKIENLTKNAIYNVTASIFTGNFEYRDVLPMKSFNTLDTDDYIPRTISIDSINVNVTLDTNSSTPIVTIKWTQTTDMICNYQLSLFSTKSASHDFRHLEPSELCHVVRPVEYETNYTLQIYGINAKNNMIEGNKSSIKFTTGRCWDLQGPKLDKCPPYPVENLTSTYEMIESNLYQVNVSWDLPKYPPDFYIVELNMKSDGAMASKNISGMLNSVHFPKVNMRDAGYDVQIWSQSKGGINHDELFVEIKEVHSQFFILYNQLMQAIIYTLPLFGILSIVFIFVFIRNRHNRLKHQEKILSNEMYLHKLIQSHNKDEMEIEPADVELHEILGEGAFGIVRRGVLKPSDREIAVKMLKGNANIEDIKEFLSEITLMKSVGQHKNIVGIVGHSTKLYNKMMLLTEYCDEGNLLDFLRRFRENFFSTTNSNAIRFSSFEKLPEDFFNFDSQTVNKFTHKDKSILERDIGNHNSERIDTKHTTTKPNLTNIASNKLYEENAFVQSHCDRELLCNNYSSTKTSDATTNKSIARITHDHGTLLFAENRGYDILPPLDIPLITDSIEMKNPELISNNKNDTNQQLTGVDLLNFAKQIAIGMDFLASNKIVHRDLAARNVLVCANKSVKIADFGLSRDIYADNIYMKSSAGRLPIKWLALESMIDQKYTSQSDVWSFGILLYEIVTLGCTPYPTVPVDCLMNYLKSGNRMSKPANCGQELYNLMFSCWHCEPEKRPNFAEISEKIEHFIEQSKTDETNRIIDMKQSEWLNEPAEVVNSSNVTYLSPLLNSSTNCDETD